MKNRNIYELDKLMSDVSTYELIKMILKNLMIN